MAADIEEDMRRAPLVAGDEERYAEAVMRHRHVGARQKRRRRDYPRQPGEQPRPLQLEAIRVGVERGRDRADPFPYGIAALGNRFREGKLALGRPPRRLRIHSAERFCLGPGKAIAYTPKRGW